MRLKRHIQRHNDLDDSDGASFDIEEAGEDHDLEEERLFKSIFDQIQNSRFKRSGNQFKRMYNVEMLRKLSGGLFDMSYLGNNQVRRQEQDN